ncbi:MAG: response regulator [Planctomycetes bacterium]|nr:response regulator [Planctomycetota bacterium]
MGEGRATEQGHEIALRQRAHPGRLRPLLRPAADSWGALSLPLIFLAGLAFESLFAQHQMRLAELALNVITVAGILLYAASRVRARTLDSHHPLLLLGALVLLLGAGGCLLGLFRDDVVPELMLKTSGTVMILFAIDRMERRSIHDLLESSEEYLESFFESMPDPLVVIGDGRRVVAANHVAIAVFGDRILGKTCCEAYLGHDDCSACTVSQAWSKRKARFELVRDARGARRFEVTTFPLFGPRGFAGKLLQQIRDVSAHAESEDRAHLLHDVVNSVDVPVLTLGLRGELLHRNRAADALFGPTAAGAQPRDGEVLPFIEDAARSAFVHSLREFRRSEAEVQLADRDGQPRAIALALAPIRAVDDRLLGTVVVARDVTEWRRLEAQVAQNEKLSAIGELVSGVAHELNNPLTAVFGFAQLLLAEELPAEQKDEVRHIYTHAQRCKKIIDGLLKFARRHQAERVRANLNEVVQSTGDLLSYQLRLANVRLEQELDPALPDSMMDSFQLQQVLINLMTNAQHAIVEAKRPGVITLRTRAAGGRIVLEAQDNGCGMPDHVMRRIFDPFFTTKGVGKGTGLGLSLSYGIVREHGGTLTVSSRPGEGSTFRIDLPVVAQPSGSAALVKATGEVAPIARSRILVVDDEPIILELMQAFLGGDGHTVSVAGGVAEALERLRDAEFDLVFSDWRMPGAGGEQLYAQLCAIGPQYRGKVVFLTGDSLSGEVVRVAQQDGNAVLNKPFTLETIRAAIARVLRPVEPLAEGTGAALAGAPDRA